MSVVRTKMGSWQNCLGVQNRKHTEDLKQPTFPYRPGLTPDELSYEVSKADNIDIDAAMMPNRRRGTDLISATGIRNIWSTQDKLQAFCVQNGALCRLNPDYSTVILASGFGDTQVVFQEVPGMILFSNGTEIGYIINGTAAPVPDTTQQFRIKLPACQCMEYYRGRVFVGKGKILYFSDAFRFFRLDARKNFKQFPDEIDLIAATTDGIYIACGGITYFMDGENPHKFELRPVAGYGAYRNTRQLISGSKLGQGDFPGDVAIWTGEEGVCCGLPSGSLKNITTERYKMPTGLTAASLIVPDVPGENYPQFITTIK
jgi:hypothetical protein